MTQGPGADTAPPARTGYRLTRPAPAAAEPPPKPRTRPHAPPCTDRHRRRTVCRPRRLRGPGGLRRPVRPAGSPVRPRERRHRPRRTADHQRRHHHAPGTAAASAHRRLGLGPTRLRLRRAGPADGRSHAVPQARVRAATLAHPPAAAQHRGPHRHGRTCQRPAPVRPGPHLGGPGHHRRPVRLGALRRPQRRADPARRRPGSAGRHPAHAGPAPLHRFLHPRLLHP